tara:strand:- start:859 stop:1335 length:477 start_codon:yes stop_codon:yes gene_type:complete
MAPNYETQLRLLIEKFPPLPHHFVDEDGGPESVIEAYNKGESIPIYKGDSENTIWGSPEANWLLRAHHDSIHLKYGIPFTPIGEYIAAEISSALAQYLGMDELALALRADIAGFAAYQAENSVFAPQEFAKELVTKITTTSLIEVGEKQMREGSFIPK